MNIIKNIGIRLFQKGVYLGCFLFNFREPEILDTSSGFAKAIKAKLNELHISDLFIVTDNGLFKLGVLLPLIKELEDEGIKIDIYHDVVANPTINNVENGLLAYKNNNHHAFLAIGGGSAMDAAKAMAARYANPKMEVKDMKGLFKLRHKLPPFFAVPTTAGTGSETTVAAIIVDDKTRDKFPIEDTKLISHYALFVPSLLVGLPPIVTATTGMDALTHAVEAFIGSSNTKKTYNNALKATKLIYEYLLKSYLEPKNLLYREKMQLAAFLAGTAFTRAYVGNVHAIAHSLGGFYNVPHGLANAIILPKVLKVYGKKAHKKLARLYDEVFSEHSLTNEEKANKFIASIEELNQKMNVTNTFFSLIKDEDIEALVSHSKKEAIPLYPTPSIFSDEDYRKIFLELKENK